MSVAGGRRTPMRPGGGGQRLATVLVYLNDVARGGETSFVDLGYRCRPKQGRALIFFPGLTDGRRDERLRHAAEPAVDEKCVCQLWVRQFADPLWSLDPPRMPAGCKSFADVHAMYELDHDESNRNQDTVCA